jgi:hypothetical protein
MVPRGHTNYSLDSPYPDVLARGRDNFVQAQVEFNDAIVAPVSGTFTLRKPGGEALISAAAVTITASVATYTIPDTVLTATLTPLGDGWQEEWSLVMSGGVDAEVFVRPAALARYQLRPVVGGRQISSLNPTWTQGRGTQVTTWQRWIDEAWGRIIRRMLTDGHVPYLVRTPDALSEAHYHLTCALICRGLKPGSSVGGESTWERDAVYHQAEYERAYTGTNWQADYDHDGVVDDASVRGRATGILYASGAPAWRGLPSGVG